MTRYMLHVCRTVGRCIGLAWLPAAVFFPTLGPCLPHSHGCKVERVIYYRNPMCQFIRTLCTQSIHIFQHLQPGHIWLYLHLSERSHDTLRSEEAILRCKCRGLVLANFCIFVPITERGGDPSLSKHGYKGDFSVLCPIKLL